MAYLYSKMGYFNLRDSINSGEIKEHDVFNTYLTENKSRIKSFMLLKDALEEVMTDISKNLVANNKKTGINSVTNQLEIDKLFLIKNLYEKDYYFYKSVLCNACCIKFNRLQHKIDCGGSKVTKNQLDFVTSFKAMYSQISLGTNTDSVLTTLDLAYNYNIGITKADVDMATRQVRY